MHLNSLTQKGEIRTLLFNWDLAGFGVSLGQVSEICVSEPLLKTYLVLFGDFNNLMYLLDCAAMGFVKRLNENYSNFDKIMRPNFSHDAGHQKKLVNRNAGWLEDQVPSENIVNDVFYRVTLLNRKEFDQFV